jgi:hypothetical protein
MPNPSMHEVTLRADGRVLLVACFDEMLVPAVVLCGTQISDSEQLL